MAEVMLLIDDLESLSGISRCRICHEEDSENSSNMESPCACSGTIKFAHRDCIQKWCNEKGNIICEICLQQYEPGYIAPPKISEKNDEAMSIREEEESNRRIEERVEGVVTESECSYAADRTAFSCRSLALTFTILLLVRHLFSTCTNGTEDYPFSMLTVIMLKASGIIIPMYIIIRIIGAIQNSIQHYYQDYYYNRSMSDGDEENQ
ncbi:PREDICTED: E3 ubiquitin-protein ligase MARCH1-like isoform X2 [Lupinus angustifolius]|uniref:E3 ubiquitin-protein ligase MARCH1-like isoform X2 n=1 Tax=Lupinus angustifolius TaxID=3871 RepID=UPI00092EE7E6|nr:PREDICTED: E3 ubiquitin-protein ligase MARCH1-like isoform X2 [Lupinus angustifolius]